MAERRMFAKTIIDSDAFLDMPLSTQALYFHLSMRADDEGFINNPKKIQRMIGATEDDLKLLNAKNFIIPFESGVVVIKHWKIHNYIRTDRLKKTNYSEEREMLDVKENGAYTIASDLLENTDVSQMSVKCQSNVGIGKDRLGKDSIGNIKDIVEQSDCHIIIDYLNQKTGKHFKDNAKATVSYINGRIREGYTVDDFKTVIDTKTAQWINDPKMKSYLRPETLFAPSHFESYLNETGITKSKYSDLSRKFAEETDRNIKNTNVNSGEFI